MDFKDFAGKVVIAGLTVSLVGSSTTTTTDSELFMREYKHAYEVKASDYCNMSFNYEFDNIYMQNNISRLEQEAIENFGVMRDATKEELQSVDDYISRISTGTGLNFFDLC